MTSSRTAPPSLEINNCEFEYFLDGYESLINVETNNFFKTTVAQVNYRGETRGAKINIKSSTIKHSRFCKGMLVYRKSPLITGNHQFLNMTHQF